MRRFGLVAVTAALASALLAGGASSHTGHGPVEVSVALYAYSPDPIQLVTGDVVNWVWEGSGPDTQHTVTADPGQAEKFDSDPGVPAQSVQHSTDDNYFWAFHRAGRFTYRCRVHPLTMRGTIVVRDPYRPWISGFAVRPGRFCTAPGCRRGRLRILLSEQSTIRGQIQRRTSAGFRTVRRIGPLRVPIGRSSHRLPVAGLAPGSYRVLVVATDTGANRSKRARAPFTVVPRG